MTQDEDQQQDVVAADNSYDELPYPGAPFPQTHPLRLSTIGALFGMQPADVRNCRVLELGCADGGNLIPMAIEMPESQFVGFDLSARQIDSGNKIREALGLENVRLEHRDVMDVDATLGTFDYVIAHGVFSWVSNEVQEKIFAIASELLNPQGIAYISYNTYPGWHMRGMLRDMMLYHTRQFSDTQTRIDQARALINFLADAVPVRDSPYGLLISGELASMQSWSDTYIFHESLEVHNEPVYFHQFAERAAKHELRYLGEANFSAMLASQFASDIATTLSQIGRDIVEMEQYMDFVRNRMFRQTLLCRAETKLDRTLTGDCCRDMYVRSYLQPASELLDLHSPEEVEFQSPQGVVASAKTPFQKAALLTLAQEYPAAISFDDLVRRAHGMLQQGQFAVHDAQMLEAQRADLQDAIFRCFCDNLMDLQLAPSLLTPSVSEKPCASPLARRQAEPGGYVTNLLHEQVQLDVLDSHLLTSLDGTRDRAALLDVLVDLATNGTIVATQDGDVIEDPDAVKTVLDQQLEARLQELARRALLLS